MGIWGNLTGKRRKTGRSERFTFAKLPESVGQMQELPEASLESPFKAAALTVAACCAYALDRQAGLEMIDFLKGPEPLNDYEKSFLQEQIRDKAYVPFSYFAGAAPENNYTPDIPYALTVTAREDSYDQTGYAKLYVRSAGSEEARFMVFRLKGGRWFLWEQRILANIRLPADKDPWA